jgi:phosphatidylglycerophosphate synthase
MQSSDAFTQELQPDAQARSGAGVATPAEAVPGLREAAQTLFSDYRKTLKPLEVEEPIDVWVHRPLAYLLAKLSYPTPVSPNFITLVSILFGLASGFAMLVPFAGHLPMAGVCLFLSAVFDCADGQLARMRGTSSAFGRMLDGVADLVVSVAAVGGSIWLIWHKYQHPTALGLVVLGLCVLTAVTGSFHTGLYDHYKNVYLRLTSRFREGESYEAAVLRIAEQRARGELGLLARAATPIYLFYVKRQQDLVRRLDPHTVTVLETLPEANAARAETYRRHTAALMRIWRTFFGFGSLVFGIALFVALDAIDYYMLARLLLMNALFFGYMVPEQRRASQKAFAELADRA